MPRLVFLLLLLVLFVHSEVTQETKRKVNSKKVKEEFNIVDEVDEEPSLYSNYADNPYNPSDSLTTTGATPRAAAAAASRSRWTTPTPFISFEDTDDYMERARYMTATTPTPTSGPSCYSVVDMNHPLLADICGALPQARYNLPNLFGHRERWQVELFLHGLVNAATDTTCLRSLRLLLCPLLFPPCTSRADPTAPTLLPCQSFCRAVKTQCLIPALEFLPCEALPMSSDLCPTSQVYGAFLPQGPTGGVPSHLTRSKPSRPVQQMPTHDIPSVPSWTQHNVGQYVQEQSAPQPMDYSSFYVERPETNSPLPDNRRVPNRMSFE